MAAMNEEKWSKLAQNAELKAELEGAESPEEALAILTSHGMDVTLDEVKQMIQEGDEELSEADLENVAGGRRLVFAGYRVVITRYPFRVRLVRVFKII